MPRKLRKEMIILWNQKWWSNTTAGNVLAAVVNFDANIDNNDNFVLIVKETRTRSWVSKLNDGTPLLMAWISNQTASLRLWSTKFFKQNRLYALDGHPFVIFTVTLHLFSFQFLIPREMF